MVNGRSAADPGPGAAEAPRPVSTVEAAVPPDPPEAGQPAAVHFDDEDRPARALTGPVGLGVSVVAALVAVLVLWQVFRPLAQGSQYYLIIFLAGTLPLVFLAYRSGIRLRRGPRPARRRD